MKAILFGEKKWWMVLLGGLFNSIAYAALFSMFCLGSMAAMVAAMCLSLIPFVLMVIVFNTISLKKLFLSTAIYAGTFILAGIPLSRFFYMSQFERLHPGLEPWAGDGFGMMVAIGFYLAMSLLAWIIAIVMTGIRSSQMKGRDIHGHPG